jgi:methionyl-tRNA formyltransferase
LLRVLFMGSPEFAVPTLRAVARVAEIVGVVTQPDKPAGRGQTLVAPAVKQAAAELLPGVPVLQPKSARAPEVHDQIRALAPDVGVVVAYGKILPQVLLDVPRHGCLNVHGSLLPRYRGAAPIQWAVIRGEAETGITIMQLDAGMDTGPMLLRRAIPIADDDTSGSLAPRLAALGAEMMVETLAALSVGALVPVPQDDSLATMAPMLKKEDGLLDFTQPARAVRDRVRGVDPWPGAYTLLGGEPLKVWSARLAEGEGAPGDVLGVGAGGLRVACGEGAITFAEVQAPGRKRMAAAAYHAGRSLNGIKLG